MTRQMQHRIGMIALWMTLSCLWMGAKAQHYVGVSLDGHATQTVDNISFTSTRISGGLGAGFTYEYKRSHFLLRTGVSYVLQMPRMAVQDESFAQEMIDTENKPFIYQGEIKDRVDRLTIHQASVPLLVGGIWSGFYFLVGAQACYLISAQAHQTAFLHTAGDYYGRYYEWLEDMPNHGYNLSTPISTKHEASLYEWDVQWKAEIGYTIPFSASSTRYGVPILRIGLFADGSILSIRKNNYTSPTTTLDFTQYVNVTMNHVYTSSTAGSASARLINYGLRLTILFPVSASSRSHYSSPHNKRYPCHCYEH